MTNLQEEWLRHAAMKLNELEEYKGLKRTASSRTYASCSKMSDSQNIWDLHQLAVTASVCEFSFFLSFFYTILIQHRSDRGSIVNWSQTASSSLLLYRFGFVLLLFLSFSPWSCIILARLWSTHHRAIMLCATPSFKVTPLELVLQQS